MGQSMGQSMEEQAAPQDGSVDGPQIVPTAALTPNMATAVAQPAPGVNQAESNTEVVDDATTMTSVVTTASSPSPGASASAQTLPDLTSSSATSATSAVINNNNNNASVTQGPGVGSFDQLTIIGASVAGGVALIALVICVSCSIFYARRDRKKDLVTMARGSAARSSTRTSTSSSARTPTPTSGKQVSRNGTVIGTNELLAAGTGASTVSGTEYDHVPSEFGSNGQLHGQGNYAVLNRQKTGVAVGYEGAKMLEQANVQNDLQAHGYGGGRVLEQANDAPYKQLTLSSNDTTVLPTLEL